jgi:hypothetical protein
MSDNSDFITMVVNSDFICQTSQVQLDKIVITRGLYTFLLGIRSNVESCWIIKLVIAFVMNNPSCECL